MAHYPSEEETDTQLSRMSYANLPEKYPGSYRKNKEGEWELILSQGKKHPLCAVKFCSQLSEKGADTGRSLKCRRCRVRLWRANNPIRAIHNAIKNKARRRGVPFSLSLEYFTSLCEETEYHKTRGRLPDDFHLDRIDCTRGYEDDNVQVITASENCKKSHVEYPKGQVEDDPF